MLDIQDQALCRLVSADAVVEQIATGFKFTEGPVWRGDHLLFSDIPSSRIVHWQHQHEGPEVRTFRTPSGDANGLTLDCQGRLIACEGGTRTVTRMEIDGSITVLADRYDDQRLNSPNDVVVRSDGSIYFTDPAFGLPNDTEGKELSYQRVYYLSPEGALTVSADDFQLPNGLSFSPDEHLLYIDDTGRNHIRVFKVRPDGTLGTGRIFAELASKGGGWTDGMKVDSEGNVYCTGPGGIMVFAPNGHFFGRIIPPELPTNLAWGDPDWKTLYITAGTSIYRVRVNVAGIPVPTRVSN